MRLRIVTFVVILSLFNELTLSLWEIPALIKISSTVGGLITAYIYRETIEEMIPENCYLHVKDPDYSDLEDKIFGQSVALSIVPEMFKQHVRDPSPKRALLFYFLGWSGTGKNYMSTLLLNKIYPRFNKNQISRFVTTFVGTHFHGNFEQERLNIKKTIDEKLAECPSSAFIFDEIDNLPSNFFDFLTGYVSVPSNGKISYNKAIFLILGNSNGQQINTIFHRMTHDEHLKREQLKYDDFESVIKNAVQNDGALVGSKLLKPGIIQLIVPFLPLTKEHVKQCIIYELKQHGYPNPMITPGPMFVDKLLNQRTYFLDEYAEDGCSGIDTSVKRAILTFKRSEF